jgi:hypothetical protein
MSLNYVLSQQSVGIVSVFASIGFCVRTLFGP